MSTKATRKHLVTLRAIAEIEYGPGRYMNFEDADECCELGWVEALPGIGKYRLTEEGSRVLAAQDA